MIKNLENWYLSILKQQRLSRVCQKRENLHVLEGFCRLLKSNLAMQVFPTHDCMRGHSCLVEASNSIKLIQYAAGGTSPVNRVELENYYE